MADLPELPGAPHAEAAKQWGVIAELLVKPLSTLAQAKADAYAIKAVAQAQIDADGLQLRARRRAVEDEICWQANLEAIAAKAMPLLQENIGTGERDPDWLPKFTEYAKNSSDEDARLRWAKVLAGEIIQPGKFSLRLLHTLNMLRKPEAERFNTFCNYIWRDLARKTFILFDDHSLPHLRKVFGGQEPWLSEFHELGLTVVSGILGNLHAKQADLLCYGGRVYSFMDWKLPKPAHAPVQIPLTALGRELLQLCTPTPDSEYLHSLAPGAFTEYQPPPSPWPWPDVPQAT